MPRDRAREAVPRPAVNVWQLAALGKLGEADVSASGRVRLDDVPHANAPLAHAALGLSTSPPSGPSDGAPSLAREYELALERRAVLDEMHEWRACESPDSFASSRREYASLRATVEALAARVDRLEVLLIRLLGDV